MALHPRVISSLSLDNPETFKKVLKEAVPYYPDLHNIPSFLVPQTHNDLIGALHIYQLAGVEKLERIFFYLMMDYSVNFVCTNYIVDSGEALPPLEHRHYIFRTMLLYRNCDWQSTNVHKIHEALNLLNDEMTALIADYYSYDYLYIRLLTHKDYNIILLKETALAQAAGLEPIDFSWGLYTPFGYEEKKYLNTWDKVRQHYIIAELQFEYALMDYDLMRYYLEKRMTLNNQEYDKFMRLKLGFEEVDMRMAGMNAHRMSYKDIVHYRTFAGESIILRYATLKADFDVLYLQDLRKLMWKVVDAYNDAFLPPEKMSMLEEYRLNMELDLERKRAAYQNRFFRKA